MVAEDEMNVSLYVGDLHADVAEVNLLKLFGESNISSCRVVRDTISKKSRGYAYVNFNSHEAAERAHDKFNQVVFLGKPIRLMWAIKNPEKRRDAKANVFIKNIDKSVDSRTIFEAFKTFGRIHSFKICTDDFGQSLGYGFIHFETEEEAEHAIERVDGIVFKNKAVTLAKFKTKKERNVTQVVAFNNVFVKNFSESEVEEVKKLFFDAGEVISSDIKFSGKDSKCFGFFCYKNQEVAERVVSCYNGTMLKSGLKIFVNRAMKKNERAAELRKNREQWKDKMHSETKNRNLYVRNFPETWKDEDLREMFLKFGEITSCKVMMDSSGRSKLFGFVCFKNEASATEATEKKSDLKVNDKPLFVALAQTKDERRYSMANHFSRTKSSGNTNQHRSQTNQLAVMPTQPMMQGYPAFEFRGSVPAVQNRNLFTPVGMKGPVAPFMYPPSTSQGPAYVRPQPNQSVMYQGSKHPQQKPADYSQGQRGGIAIQMGTHGNYRISSNQRQQNDQYHYIKQVISEFLKKAANDDFVKFVGGRLSSQGRDVDSLSEVELKRLLEDWSKSASQNK